MFVDDPVVAQIQLGILLRELRERAGLTADEARRSVDLSSASMSRIENGKQEARPEVVAALLELYEAGDADSAEALRLAAVPKPRARRRRSASYRDAAPNWFTRFLVLEGEASDIWVYENEAITGLLQTADYARATLQAGAPLASRQEVDKRVDLRIGRQRILTRDEPPPAKVEAILHEAALHRVIGDDAVMAAQLAHLLDIGERANVDIRVLPFRPEPTSNHDESFVAAARFILLKLPERGTMLYLDDFAGATYPEDITVIQEYAAAYQRLRNVARDPGSSRELIAKLVERYR
ncbi:XRE family transcriptional regulator [Actinoalloteichus sp. AHMU CJ021]|uniref:helix-turn-helix domain-containing protein n=1 Tax=Actinoalloteichus TaxID=65496 RepID=UPI0004AA8FD9|nr:helix-turn-helix transcriptional regulator [Actinoalloteichus caeruleus]AUS79004.1 XRE family transcriptional regulator [Actinoalloteichus sp. AHMU CJ021]